MDSADLSLDRGLDRRNFELWDLRRNWIRSVRLLQYKGSLAAYWAKCKSWNLTGLHKFYLDETFSLFRVIYLRSAKSCKNCQNPASVSEWFPTSTVDCIRSFVNSTCPNTWIRSCWAANSDGKSPLLNSSNSQQSNAVWRVWQLENLVFREVHQHPHL